MRGALHPPLWARWVLTILGFAVLVVVIAIVVHKVNHESTAPTAESVTAEKEANREAEIVIAQDQEPHTAALRAPATGSEGSGSASGSASATRTALERAIAGDVNARIDDGALTGPLQSIRCQTSGAASGGRQPFRCTVRSAGITYPFLAVANERRGELTLTWCKVDPPPTPGATEAPVSPRCRA
jgi:hypothetical protein